MDRRRALLAAASSGSGIPNNEIWYTSSDGKVVTPYSTKGFGANIVSNTYENGKGVIKFDGPVRGDLNMTFPQSNTLTSVTLPNRVISIGDYAFYNCPNLTDVPLNNNIVTIGAYAFQYCEKLVSINLPESLSIISNSAFSRCGFVEITLPEYIISIGNSAFATCKGLTKIVCKRKTPPAGGQGMFNNIHSSAKIYVPVGSGNAYKTAQYWSAYTSIIVEQ